MLVGHNDELVKIQLWDTGSRVLCNVFLRDEVKTKGFTLVSPFSGDEVDNIGYGIEGIVVATNKDSMT